MSTNQWEKSWKNKLDDYSSPVDSSLFEAIAAKAVVKSSKTYLIGWMSAGLILLSSATIIFISSHDSASGNISDIAASAEMIAQPAITPTQDWNGLLNPANDLAYKPSESNSIDLNRTASNQSEDNNLTQAQAATNKTSSKNKSANIKQYKPSIHTADPSSLLSSKSGRYQTKPNSKDPLLSIAEKQVPSLNVIEDGIENNSMTRPDVSRTERKQKMEDAWVRFGVAQPISVLFPTKIESPGLALKYTDPGACFNDARGRSSFYIDGYAGAGNSIRSLNAVENQYSYMHLRDSLEKSWYNSAVGGRLGFILASGMAIETGAEYQVHNEIFEYKNESEVRITYKYHYDQFGNVIRTDTITEVGTRTLKTHNKYKQITIPLRLGYTMEKGNWMLGARVGVGLHIWNHQNGVILDNTYQTYKIEEDPNGYFNDNWGMQFNASLQIGYRILPQVFLMIEPVWNYQSGGITKQPYTIEQKYQTLRMNVGIRYVPANF